MEYWSIGVLELQNAFCRIQSRPVAAKLRCADLLDCQLYEVTDIDKVNIRASIL